MNSVYSIGASCLRYIVPFKYDGSFEEALKRVEDQKREKKQDAGDSKGQLPVWERRISSYDGSESDLYDYIRNEFRFDAEQGDLPEEKAGCEWLYWRSDEARGKDGKKISELVYFPDGISAKTEKLTNGVDISITNLGLVLYRNGLGIVWYELSADKDAFDSDSLKVFQNKVRELNREVYFWEKTSDEPQYGLVTREKELNDGTVRKEYITPFLIGPWLEEVIGIIKFHYLAERKAGYKASIKKALSSLSSLPNEKVGTDNEIPEMPEFAPDKAILFTYGTFDAKSGDDSAEDRKSFAYHMTNGYRDSYHFSSDVSETIWQPFDDVLWYATQEGAAYIAWPQEDNRVVFNTLILSKFKRDYFTLYMKVLYQSFSLLIYAEMIQREISAVNGKYLIEPLDKRITELFGEINLFLTKSMATSVSHIHHQSEFYIYLKQQIRVHDDVKSVTAGLNALDILQREQRQRDENKRIADEWQAEQKRDHQEQLEREKREEREKKSDSKIQAIMGLFALLGISSALVDCFDFISKFDPKGDWAGLTLTTQLVELVFVAIIGVIGVIAIYFAVKAIVSAFKNKE